MNLTQRRCAMFVVVTLTAMSCGGGDGSSTTSESGSATTASTTPNPTTAPPATATSSTVAPSTSGIPPCDADAMVEHADVAVRAARLAGWPASWDPAAGSSDLIDRTVGPSDFAAGLGLDCSLLVQQFGPGGGERLFLAAWTGDRTAYVLQATDQPDPPFAEEVRFDLLAYWVDGEWIGDQVWAGTLRDGGSLVLGTSDYPIGAVAKAWQIAFPEPPSPPPGNDAEAYAIAALETAGARNVGIAEPTTNDIASIAFMTPQGSVMIATVGPVGSLGTESYLTGDASTTTVEGVTVTLTLPGPDQYDVAQVIFTCRPYVWWINAGFGTPDEVVAWTEEVIGALTCS